MKSRYIFVENDSFKSSMSPERSFEAFVDCIKTAIVQKTKRMNEEGVLDILQLYSKLDFPKMNERYDRLMIGRAYEFVSLTQQLVNQGILRLEGSSWGDKEKNDENHIGTQPGLEDMRPNSLGYNNNGGPTYSISVSKEGIEMQAGFCHQDFSSSWDTIDTSYKWQYRTFYFVPVGQDDETLKQMLEPFKDWIIYRFSNRVKHDLLYDFINQAADTFLDRFLENNNS
ncbi:hypothetical protein SAMN04487899_103158 [Segatella bryantii]|jgi:hypothetical protein|nr:hypothetical protein SAMN04487899_103158 [Segatella bryantii]